MRAGGQDQTDLRLQRRSVLLGAAALCGLTSRSAWAGDDASGLGNDPSLPEPKSAIIFVGASWCPVCKEAAPLLALFCEVRGLPVLVASADERPIAPFETFVPTRQNAVAEQVTQYPTTLVFSSVTRGIVGGFEGFRSPAIYVRTIATLVDQAEALA